MYMNDNPENIFKKHFNGTLDELLNYTQTNADFVQDVLSGKKEVMLNDEESITMILEEYPTLTKNTAKELLDNIKLEIMKDTINTLIEDGLVESKGLDPNTNEEVFGLTELGELYYNHIKNKNNQ
jgi:hypothetical protein